ncbi:MAG TPA: ATP-binding cassette domain-containing protein, partial [Xanthobacteraceae bacterium]|nr:ATP-binding cassette domain-containing protein [Xanthobacteraceae bacterium]
MLISAAEAVLAVRGLETGYGKLAVVHGVDLTVGAGEVVALLGPNGAGKTTLLRAISGLLPWTGHVQLGERNLRDVGPREAVRAGLSHVIEGHRVFTQLSVTD